MAKARKYRVWAATAESTSWEVAASLCFRSNYSLQKLLYISDKTMFNRRRVLFKPPTSKNETPLSRRHLPPWSSAPTTPPTAPCLCPLHRCWHTHINKVWNNRNMLSTLCLQPLAPMETTVAERLFVVCTPGPPPIYALKDVFGRFGGLIDVYLLKVIITIDLWATRSLH